MMNFQDFGEFDFNSMSSSQALIIPPTPAHMVYTLRDSMGRVVRLQQAVVDNHIQSALGNIFLGANNQGGIADQIAPIVYVDKKSGYLWESPTSNTFDEAIFSSAGAGSAYNEVSPSFSTKQYDCTEYALGSFLPTQVEANADAVFELAAQYGEFLANKFVFREERAVANKVFSATSYNAANVVDIGATANRRWLDTATGIPGANSDPVKDIQDLQLKSYLPIDAIVMNELVGQAFLRHPKVQEYTKYKDGFAPLGEVQARFRDLGLPRPIISKMRVSGAAGTLPGYLWSQNHVALLHVYDPSRVRTGTDTGNVVRYRWRAYDRIPGATNTQGMLTRMFFHPYRGFAGGKQMVMAVAQDERVLEPNVGGLLQNVVVLSGIATQHEPQPSYLVGVLSCRARTASIRLRSTARENLSTRVILGLFCSLIIIGSMCLIPGRHSSTIFRNLLFILSCISTWLNHASSASPLPQH